MSSSGRCGKKVDFHKRKKHGGDWRIPVEYPRYVGTKSLAAYSICKQPTKVAERGAGPVRPLGAALRSPAGVRLGSG